MPSAEVPLVPGRYGLKRGRRWGRGRSGELQLQVVGDLGECCALSINIPSVQEAVGNERFCDTGNGDEQVQRASFLHSPIGSGNEDVYKACF